MGGVPFVSLTTAPEWVSQKMTLLFDGFNGFNGYNGFNGAAQEISQRALNVPSKSCSLLASTKKHNSYVGLCCGGTQSATVSVWRGCSNWRVGQSESIIPVGKRLQRGPLA